MRDPDEALDLEIDEVDTPAVEASEEVPASKAEGLAEFSEGQLARQAARQESASAERPGRAGRCSS